MMVVVQVVIEVMERRQELPNFLHMKCSRVFLACQE
jgi:hypothetical protein